MSDTSAWTKRLGVFPAALNDLSFRIEERLFRTEPKSRFGRGLRLSAITIHAMILREAITRYGTRSAGFVWALVEPLLQMSVLIALFSFMGRRQPIGDSIVIFFLTGIIPLLIFRGALSRGAGALTANTSLAAYRQVGPFEIITSRMILEFVIFSGVVGVMIVTMKAFAGLPVSSWLSEPMKLFGVLGVFFILSYGACYLSAQIGRIFPFWRTLIGLSGRILFFTSGVWFTLGTLPATIRPYVKYNPLAHIIEWFRDAVISGFDSDHYDVMYPLQFGVVCLFIGLFIGWLVRLAGYENTE